ncbi:MULTISPECIES: hypothetical protein [unclassified Streptomyces]|uniref:hypothetical protein n=1 Tax=unclassified Streptomyces TaxID=2593676 RepID=UPI000B508525|nr:MULTISPECIES: hypothetical protein [unclassified Streptomyces]MYX03603.1 hypothetical protein [Streptomyces sp. SID8378]SNB85138.1 hypothetical protein SAMN02745831_02454 [Streptomyces sp. PgraA7]
MAQHTPAPTRICPDCDGFPAVAIDTGILLEDGTRATLTVTCRPCQGTGTTHTPATAPVVQREHA